MLANLTQDERGQALFQTALFLPLLLVVLGLVVDGGLLLTSYRRAQIAADTAAHAASHQISIEVFVESNQVVLGAPAFDKALEYGRTNSYGHLALNTVSILNQGRLVRVTGHASLPTCFMRLVGISSITVPVVGEAYPAYGIEEEWQ
jgi:Flp pilus assembly protein TadG